MYSYLGRWVGMYKQKISMHTTRYTYTMVFSCMEIQYQFFPWFRAAGRPKHRSLTGFRGMV